MNKRQEHLLVEQKWNEQFASPHIAKRNWQIFSFILALVVLCLSYGFVYLSNKAQVIPYIVEVDNLGRAVNAGMPKPDVNKDLIIRAYLFRFIDLSRSVITDGEAMKSNLDEAYKMVDLNVKRNFLDKYYKNNNPFDFAKERSKQIFPLTFLKQSENTYIVEWSEIVKDSNLNILFEDRLKAVVTVIQKVPDKKAVVDSNPYNPFGIYITNIDWSKLM
ncbi:MAG: hypothetical protein KJ864_00325 [Candidatus Omnitrophica bacterium]|nr:hypothetical protein [Candidatus Omnitrophota bacterium]